MSCDKGYWWCDGRDTAHLTAETVADANLTPREVQDAKDAGMTPAEYIEASYGIEVDPEVYSDEHELARAISEVRQEGHVEAVSPDERALQAASDASSAEEIADACLTPSEAIEADEAGISAVDYIKREYGVDAQSHTENSLNRAISRSIDGGGSP